MGTYYRVQCAGCKYDSAIFDRCTMYNYEGKEERRPVIRNYCYCELCKSVENVLEPFTIRNLSTQAHEFLSTSKKPVKKSFISNLFTFKTKKQRYNEGKINSEIERLEYFQNNNHQLKCFHCSSFKIKLINLPSKEDQILFIDITHECGGQLYISNRGFICIKSAAVIRYTEFGRIGSYLTTL